MQPHAAERRHLERQIAYARPIFAVLALGDLLGRPAQDGTAYAVGFILAYLGLSVVLLLLPYLPRLADWRVPLAADLLALAVFLLLADSVPAFWFLYLFVALAAGIRWGMERCIVLAGVVSLAVLLRATFSGGFGLVEVVTWVALAVGTFTAGVGLSFLGDRHRRHAAEHEFLACLTGMLQVERGVSESLRSMLGALAAGFQCEKAAFAFRDPEMDRLFVWTTAEGQTEHTAPQSLPASSGDVFLLDRPEVSFCLNELSANGTGPGFAWRRDDGRRLQKRPDVPQDSRSVFGLRSVLAVTVDLGAHSAGRLLVGNGRRPFQPQDLRWLEHVGRHLSTPLANLFLLRRLRTRAIEGERSRISRDIHDGILQTLLSVDIQLDVLRRRAVQDPAFVAAELGTLQNTVRSETEELRRMVTDLRPLGVQSADLVDLMRGFAERFRNESGVALDLLTDAAALQVPDRICRELFQIYREALHNVKKHARATHVVVKLWQTESHVVLVVDDNGQGFSFEGRYTGDELDRLRLGPISIKERTRSVGGVLTVESTPGSGARVIVEVPLG